MHNIVVEDLQKAFVHRNTSSEMVAIDHLNFEIVSGELVAIVGRTGCGKSTFLNIMLGLDRPTGGRILVDGYVPYDDFNHFRGKIAGIFQQDRLMPWRSALDNVRFGLEILGRSEAEQIEIAKLWLDRMGLGDYLDSYPQEMSGGMRQRVSMARAYAVNPDILMVDEAFGHLDEVTAHALRASFKKLARVEKKTAVMVTHQLDEAFEMAERILVFGRPARILMDINMTTWKGGNAQLRREIRDAIESNVKPPSVNDAVNRAAE